jgi:hypothetical protein
MWVEGEAKEWVRVTYRVKVTVRITSISSRDHDAVSDVCDLI